MKLYLLIILACYSLLLSAGQTLFKKAAEGLSLNAGVWHFTKTLIVNANFLYGCILYGFATFAWVALLRKFQLSSAYPIATALSILITVISGVFLFNERLSTFSLVGVILIFTGVIILSKSIQ